MFISHVMSERLELSLQNTVDKYLSCCCLRGGIVVVLFLLFCFRAILIFSPSFHSVASIFLYIHFFPFLCASIFFIVPFSLLPHLAGLTRCPSVLVLSRGYIHLSASALSLFVPEQPLFTFATSCTDQQTDRSHGAGSILRSFQHYMERRGS